MPRPSSRAIVVGDGGAPAVVIDSEPPRSWASLAPAMVLSTTGAPAIRVTFSASMSRQASGPRTARMHTCVPDTAVSAQVVHQPLQWNIGSVHRYLVRAGKSCVMTSPSEFRYAPRWVYMTPFGRPVVPDV